jgi:hypothetical protein
MWDNIKMNLQKIENEDKMLPRVTQVLQDDVTLRIGFSCVHVTHSNTSWLLSATEGTHSVHTDTSLSAEILIYRLANFVASHSASPV